MAWAGTLSSHVCPEGQRQRTKNPKVLLPGVCPRQKQAGHGWLSVVLLMAEETACLLVEVVVHRYLNSKLKLKGGLEPAHTR